MVLVNNKPAFVVYTWKHAYLIVVNMRIHAQCKAVSATAVLKTTYQNSHIIKLPLVGEQSMLDKFDWVQNKEMKTDFTYR